MSADLEAPFVYTDWDVWSSDDQRMWPEREYCYTCQRPVPYDRDTVSDARHREADRGIVRRLNAKEEQRLIRQERDQSRVSKSDLETRYTVLQGMYERMCADSLSQSLLKVQPTNFRSAAFLGQLKAKIGSSLAKAAALRVNLNIDGAPITM